MSDNGFKDGKQFPFPLVDEGKSYEQEIQSRASAILSSLMGFRPSNYRSSIPSNQYSNHMRAMANELAKLTFRLEQIRDDQSFDSVRSEFLYQTVGHLVFLNDKLPELEFDDEEFRNFLLKVIEIYFQGSTPESIRDAVELFTDEDFQIIEKFKDARKDTSTQDIGDQFEFSIEFDLQNSFPGDPFELQKNINLLIQLVKPAHTLFATRHLFGELFDTPEDVETEHEMKIKDFQYEDVRSYWGGMKGFTSDEGFVEQSDKNLLKDHDTNSHPIGHASVGSEVVVFKGDNAGIYRIVDANPDNHTVTIYPAFDFSEDPIEYHIQMDRKGVNKEIKVEDESATHQFRPTSEITVSGNGPYSTIAGSKINLNASSNYDKVEFKWDLTGDGTYNNATGDSIQVDTSQYNRSEITVGVKAISQIYGKKYDNLDEGEKAFYEPGAEAIDQVKLYLL